MSQVERWRPIPGYPGYEASDMGRVGSYQKPGPGTQLRDSPRLIHGKLRKDGYREYQLSTNDGPVWICGHRLVMLAFQGAPPKEHEVNHLDGDKSNNRLSNLEYVTGRENMVHAASIGRAGGMGAGEENGKAKLSEDDVVQIRRLYADGGRYQYQIAERYGITQVQVSSIVRGETWPDAGGPISNVGAARGERAGVAILTEDDVREIRRKYEEGGPAIGYGTLAGEYGVSTGTIRDVIQRRNWKHV